MTDRLTMKQFSALHVAISGRRTEDTEEYLGY